MRIGLDARAITAAPHSGIARQVQALRASLSQRPGTTVCALSAAPIAHPDRQWAHCPEQAYAAEGLHRPLNRWRFERRFLPQAITTLQLDVHVATCNMGLPLGLTRQQRQATRWVLQLHDVFQLTLRNRHPSAWREWAYRQLDRLSIRHSLALADAIWVPSAFTAQALCEQVPGVAARVRVLPNAVPFDAWQGACAAVGPRVPASHYWLLVGTHEPRKNTAWFVGVWQQARARWPGLIPELVLVGACPDLPALPQGAHRLTDVNDEAMRQCYTLADRFWHPAYAEGFGLPVVEAAACGTPMAVALGSALDEVTPPGAPRFDPHDGPALLQLMHDLAVAGRGTPEASLALQDWARRFDSPAHAQGVDALLKELM